MTEFSFSQLTNNFLIGEKRYKKFIIILAVVEEIDSNAVPETQLAFSLAHLIKNKDSLNNLP